ncbi:hypothetical protein EUGRSUZ_E03485 [Eucalyptus grandis]|uniref:Uncharacterized protein n=2 Tax=Eucalyptus grandis TaxID=71139 RepID=A0ACC3KZS2_EUCGR|nr:hypothetical protein EUGRSUZ_E03485 [Eucalyptus grandis]
MSKGTILSVINKKMHVQVLHFAEQNHGLLAYSEELHSMMILVVETIHMEILLEESVHADELQPTNQMKYIHL